MTSICLRCVLITLQAVLEVITLYALWWHSCTPSLILAFQVFFSIYFLFAPKFRLFFENHFVLKKRNVNVFQAVPFLLVAGSL